MKKKIVGILVMMLLIGITLTSIGTTETLSEYDDDWKPTQEISATDIIWEFFKYHPKQ